MLHSAYPYQIRWALLDDWPIVMDLAWKTFLEFEKDDYTTIGIENFRTFVKSSDLYKMFLKNQYKVAVACENSKIVGMISIRNDNHISLLFVDKQYHKLGIGTNLIYYLANYVKHEILKNNLTVESSPYAVEFYHKLGFIDSGRQNIKSGIITTPMEKDLRLVK